MKLSFPSTLKRFSESRWWEPFGSVIFGAIFLYMIIPSGWRFSQWIREMFSIVWPIAFLVAILCLGVAFAARRVEDTPVDDPLTQMHYKYNRLEEAYAWMRGAALAALVSLLILWLIIRDKL